MRIDLEKLKENEFTCTIDIERMNQVFTNILSNAVKYTDNENGEVALTSKINRQAAELVIGIHDNGEGIDKESLASVFDRFYKRSPVTTDTLDIGSGLGLAIVKEIIQSHEGTIWVESEVNYGTSFYISLPLDRIEAAEKHEQEKQIS